MKSPKCLWLAGLERGREGGEGLEGGGGRGSAGDKVKDREGGSPCLLGPLPHTTIARREVIRGGRGRGEVL